jgi:hypothetical protein
MSDIRFLLDENLTPRYRKALLQRERLLIVWHVGLPGAPPKGTLDPVILDWCEANEFVLVTNNRRSMPVHLREHLVNGRHIPGILVISEQMTMGEIIDDLLLIWGASLAEELRDQIIYLPIS